MGPQQRSMTRYCHVSDFVVTSWFLHTEHVLQTDDAGEVVVEVDVVVVVSKPQAEQLQQLVVQLHPCRQTTFISNIITIAGAAVLNCYSYYYFYHFYYN